MIELVFVDGLLIHYWPNASGHITKTIPESHSAVTLILTDGTCTGAGTIFKQLPTDIHDIQMDLIIFFKAIGNLLFAAILFLAVLITSAFSMLVYLFKGLTPAIQFRKGLLFRRK
jgi:hypothetical protein